MAEPKSNPPPGPQASPLPRIESRRAPMTPVPPSGGASGRYNTALVGVGMVLATAVPISVQSIEDATMRTLILLLSLIVVFGVGYLITPGAGPTIGKK